MPTCLAAWATIAIGNDDGYATDSGIPRTELGYVGQRPIPAVCETEAANQEDAGWTYRPVVLVTTLPAELSVPG